MCVYVYECVCAAKKRQQVSRRQSPYQMITRSVMVIVDDPSSNVYICVCVCVCVCVWSSRMISWIKNCRL